MVRTTLERLMREGLDRHDAIHAIGGVLMGIVLDAFKQPGGKQMDISTEYGRQLAELTAASGRSQ